MSSASDTEQPSDDPTESSEERDLGVSGESLGGSASGESHESGAADDFLRALARAPSEAPPSPELAPGTRVGEFEILGKLGQGGMGVVYAAKDQKLQRHVALKVLPEEIRGERRKRFLREARSASAVDHPNIATVFAVGEDAGTIFIAMERVFGLTLRDHLKAQEQAALPEGEALRITREIALALVKAHGVGVVHRDLKPENVMLTEEGRVKILDFGLAKLRDPELGSQDTEESELATREGKILGTPSYMSPEQAKGRGVDERSDLFSLGVVLYEMLSGKRPFRGTTTVELLIAIDRDDYSPLTGADPALAALVARCLAKAPEERFPDAAALVAAIDSLPEARARARRRRGLWLAAALLLALAAAASLVALGGSTSPEVERPRPEPSVAPAPPASFAQPSLPASALGPSPAPSAAASAPPGAPPKPRPFAPPRPDPLSDQK